MKDYESDLPSLIFSDPCSLDCVFWSCLERIVLRETSLVMLNVIHVYVKEFTEGPLPQIHYTFYRSTEED